MRNDVWKWVAGLLAAALMSGMGTYMAFAGDRIQDKERLVKVEQAIIYLTKIVERMERHHFEHDN